MGRTSKPLNMLVSPAIAEWPEVQKLAAQGHRVDTTPGLLRWWEYDLILGGTCHMMTEHERKWLTSSAIVAARRRKYPKAKPEELEEL